MLKADQTYESLPENGTIIAVEPEIHGECIAAKSSSMKYTV